MTLQIMRGYGSYGDAKAHRKFGQEPLTRDELRAAAPSIFAPNKHESRSERYTYIPTIDVVDKLAEEGFRPYTVKQGRTRIPGKADFTKHLIRFRHDSLRDVKSGDTVLEVALRNAHDGTASWELMGALWRVTCLNALVSGGEMLIHAKIPHKGNQLDNVVEGTYQVLEESKQLLRIPEDWGGIQLNRDEQMAFARAAHALRFEPDTPQAAAIEPAELIRPQRVEDRGNDLYRLFNVTQERIIKGGVEGVAVTTDAAGNERARRVTTRAVKGIDDDVRLNRGLWVLAEEMRRLKA